MSELQGDSFELTGDGPQLSDEDQAILVAELRQVLAKHGRQEFAIAFNNSGQLVMTGQMRDGFIRCLIDSLEDQHKGLAGAYWLPKGPSREVVARDLLAEFQRILNRYRNV